MAEAAARGDWTRSWNDGRGDEWRAALPSAVAMMAAGRETIGDGVAECEMALATPAAETRTAADLLAKHYSDARMSPNTHFLQIMASGPRPGSCGPGIAPSRRIRFQLIGATRGKNYLCRTITAFQ